MLPIKVMVNRLTDKFLTCNQGHDSDLCIIFQPTPTPTITLGRLVVTHKPPATAHAVLEEPQGSTTPALGRVRRAHQNQRC